MILDIFVHYFFIFLLPKALKIKIQNVNPKFRFVLY